MLPTSVPPFDTPPIEDSHSPAARHGGSHADDLASGVKPHPRGFGENLGRFLLVGCLALLVIAGLGYLKYRQVHAMILMAASGAFIPPPMAVTTYVVHEARWQPTLRAIGSLEAVQGTTVSADLAGIVKEIDFESGKPVKAGDILVRLVTDQEQAQLEAAEAQRDLAVYNLKRERDLLDKKTASQSEFDTAEASERQNEAMVANAKAAIERKTIRAPFKRIAWHPQGEPGSVPQGRRPGRGSPVDGPDLR